MAGFGGKKIVPVLHVEKSRDQASFGHSPCLLILRRWAMGAWTGWASTAYMSAPPR